MLILLDFTRYDPGHCAHVTVYRLASVHGYKELQGGCRMSATAAPCLVIAGYLNLCTATVWISMDFLTSTGSSQSAVTVVTSCPSLLIVSWNCAVVLRYILVVLKGLIFPEPISVTYCFFQNKGFYFIIFPVNLVIIILPSNVKFYMIRKA
jgi:hypothetical protein